MCGRQRVSSPEHAATAIPSSSPPCSTQQRRAQRAPLIGACSGHRGPAPRLRHLPGAPRRAHPTSPRGASARTHVAAAAGVASPGAMRAPATGSGGRPSLTRGIRRAGPPRRAGSGLAAVRGPLRRRTAGSARILAPVVRRGSWSDRLACPWLLAPDGLGTGQPGSSAARRGADPRAGAGLLREPGEPARASSGEPLETGEPAQASSGEPLACCPASGGVEACHPRRWRTG